jgi:hypothetical protein
MVSFREIFGTIVRFIYNLKCLVYLRLFLYKFDDSKALTRKNAINIIEVYSSDGTFYKGYLFSKPVHYKKPSFILDNILVCERSIFYFEGCNCLEINMEILPKNTMDLWIKNIGDVKCVRDSPFERKL